MKKNIVLFLAVILAVCCFPQKAGALEAYEIGAETAVLMDAETGQVLFAKNPDKLMYPASTTKIMTGLLTAELCDMESVATVTKSAVEIDEWDSANISLIPGEKMTVDDLMYGMMLPSANDAANVLAEHASGSQADFAQRMTQRARSLGAVNTNFENAHGLHDQNHYTTAHDMALITREAIKNPYFMKYFGAPSHTVPPTNLQPSPRSFTNYQHMLLPDSRFYDPRVIGGKIGYTHEAKHTMSTVKAGDGRTLIAVVMGEVNRDGKFYDTDKLFRFGLYEFIEVVITRDKFSGFEAEIIDSSGRSGPVAFKPAEDFKALLHKSIDPASIKISYSREGPFKVGEDVEVFAGFYVSPQNHAIPDLLGRVKMTEDYSVFIGANSEEPYFRGMLFQEIINRRRFVSLMALGVSVLVFIAVFALKYIRARRLQRRRRESLDKCKNRESLRL